MKKHLTKLLAAALLFTGVGIGQAVDGPLVAQTGLDDQRKQRIMRQHNVPLGDYYTGRSPYSSQRMNAPARKVTPAPVQAAPQPPPAGNCAVAETDLTYMTKTMPAEVGLGEEFMYTIYVMSKDCIADVVVTDMIPDGASFVKSEPKAQVNGKTLKWRYAEMDPGASGEIKVWLRADKEGTLASCATIHALPRACAETFVGKATLAIAKTGPEQALLGSQVTYDIVVQNTGTTVAKNVVVTDTVPAGLTHASGEKTLTFQVGDMLPGASRAIPVSFTAAQRGNHCNKAVAKSSNAGQVSDDACTLVVERGLDIVKTGHKEAILNKTADYQIKVTNTGDTPLNDVVVTDTAPYETSIVKAEGASISGNTATWNVGQLAAGASKSFAVTLTSTVPGTHCNGAAVATREGLSKSAQACTLWKGISALLLEVVDDPDPIRVGGRTTYTIRVTNQGTAEDADIKVVAKFPEQVKPISTPEGTVNGQTVNFPPYAILAPKASFQYTIVAEGANIGIARVQVTRTSRDIPVDISEDESTRVY